MQPIGVASPLHKKAWTPRRALLVRSGGPLLVLAGLSRPDHHLLQQIVLRCAASAQQLWSAAAAAHQQQHPQLGRRNWKQQSLSIGAGVGAAACSGAGGGNGWPPSSGGWGSGGDGSGWGGGHCPGSSSSPGSNVLADVAAAGDVSSETVVEEVVLLDVGGES